MLQTDTVIDPRIIREADMIHPPELMRKYNELIEKFAKDQ